MLLSAPKRTMPASSEVRSDNLNHTAEEAARAAYGSFAGEAPGTELCAEPRQDNSRKTESERTLTTSTPNCCGREILGIGMTSNRSEFLQSHQQDFFRK